MDKDHEPNARWIQCKNYFWGGGGLVLLKKSFVFFIFFDEFSFCDFLEI